MAVFAELICDVGMEFERGDIKDQVHKVYSKVAQFPGASHPFRVGRKLAERAGYKPEWLATIPPDSVDSFAGVSCVPCFALPPPGSRVLDLGCGAGLDALLVSSQARSVVGVDFSDQMVQRAKRSAAVMGVTNVEFRQGDAESIPAATESFDVAIINGIFNLNPARDIIHKELARVMVPGGLVFAAELVLKGPMPPDVQSSNDDWFA